MVKNKYVTKEYNIPNELIIEVTSKCNLNCNFCFNKNNEEEEKLNFNIIKKIILDAKNSKIKSIRFSGGEPFLRKDLKEILKFSKENNIYNILNTNALLINKDNLNTLDNVDMLLISLHETKKFKKIIEFLKLIKDKKIKVVFATILNQDNIKNLEKYYSFIYKLNEIIKIEWILLREIKKEILNEKNLDLITTKIKNLNYKYKQDIKISNALPFCAHKELENISVGGFTDSGYSRLLIDTQGNYKIDYSTDKLLGNVFDKKIIEIWNSEFMKDIRNYKKTIKKCQKCELLSACRGGLIFFDFRS